MMAMAVPVDAPQVFFWLSAHICVFLASAYLQLASDVNYLGSLREWPLVKGYYASYFCM